MFDKPYILIVDDQASSRAVLRHALGELHAEVVEVADGREALSAAHAHPFALAILDVSMPGMDGYELAGRLRTDAHTRAIPIMFLTASAAEPHHTFRGYEAGAVDYIVKPFDRRILLAKAKFFLDAEAFRPLLRPPQQYVLAVDDRPANLAALRQVLADVDATIVEAANGNDALATTIDHHFAVAILDVNMPGMSGFELAALLRGDESTEHIPIIFVTAAHADETKVFEGYEAGGVDYIVKPYDPHVLRSKVGVFLELDRAREEVRRHRDQLEAMVDARTAELRERLAEIRQAQELLRAQEEELSAIYAHAPLTMILVDADRRVRKVNEAGLAAGNVNASDILGKRGGEALRCIHALDAAEGCGYGPACRGCTLRRVVLHTLETGEPAREVEAPLHVGDPPHADERVVLLSTARLRLRDGYSVLVTLQDITARRHAEDEREAERLRAQEYLDIADVILVAIDAVGLVTMINRKGCQVLGYPEDEIVGRNWFEGFVPERARADVLPVHRALLDAAVAGGTHTENPVLTRDGEERLIAWDGVPMRDSEGRVVGHLSCGQDITEKRAMEMQLRQAQKLEAIGTLAGGVAHDFNNLATAILGCVGFCHEGLGPDHPAHEWIDEIDRATQRCVSLTRQLLAFARRQEIVPEVLDLNATVSGMLKLLGRLIGEGIELAWEPGEDVWPVEIDPSQIDQILANLCVNARDAIDGVGEVTIRTANVRLDGASWPEVQSGEYVMLEVCDTGCGMDSETLAQIFDPFFTTKESGKGTGMGMATVYGIVKQNQGHIHVESELGRGTTFRIYLRPLLAGVVDAPMDDEPQELSGGSGVVLLVEDEESVRTVVSRYLGMAGYTVLAAETPEAALRMLGDDRGDIRLVVTDVVMPGMNGVALAARVQEARPEIKCLFMSGYTADIVANCGIEAGSIQLLSKPFSAGDLVRKVRQVLEGDSM